ncbi:hypothetical protein JCM14076_29570 [Methylosoma difficile]
MDKIRLLYSENMISRKKHRPEQVLNFFMVVENLHYDKQVDVIWAGEDQEWHAMPAKFHSKLDGNREYWLATATIRATAEQSLPGNIEFSLCFQSKGAIYWDNNHGKNYKSQADCGVILNEHVVLQNVHFSESFTENQKYIPVTVAVAGDLAAQQVSIHWSSDNWRHSKTTHCHFQRQYWDKQYASNARNPNQNGVQIWKTWLKVGYAFRVEYSICCISEEQIVWDNNAGNNYSISRKQLQMLTLNLHCYQEEDQDHKFSLIAQAISDHQVDIVCFQEVAELWNNGMGDWQSNAARIINDRLPEPFHLYTDWSHLGFDRYREGLAILSRYPLSQTRALYVSDSQDPYSIHSRKALMAEIIIPYLGPINVFCAHLSWWEDGFANQYKRLREWAKTKQEPDTQATLLCGDFNVAVGSKGYQLVLESSDYEDQYLAANPDILAEQNFRQKDPYWQNYQSHDYRIDYMFINKSSDLKAVAAKSLFTDSDYGRVSDHCGYLMTFEPK